MNNSIEETNDNCSKCDIILTDDDMDRADGKCECCNMDDIEDDKWFNGEMINVNGVFYLKEEIENDKIINLSDINPPPMVEKTKVVFEMGGKPIIVNIKK